MSVPINFRKAQEAIIQSYAFTDIITGTAYQLYYGYNTDEGAGTLSGGYLTTQTFNSKDMWTKGAGNFTAGLTKTAAKDFDLDFGIPQEIDGRFIVNMQVGIKPIGGTPNITTQPDIILKKVHGSTISVLGQVSGASWTQTGATANYDKNFTMSADISRTHFAIGDILRVSAEVHSQVNAVSCIVALGHDPANRTENLDITDPWMLSGTSSKVLKVLIPFRAVL